MSTSVASVGLRAHLRADPCLWYREIVDPCRDGALVYSSWADEWIAYDSREEALSAGEARLGELTRAA